MHEQQMDLIDASLSKRECPDAAAARRYLQKMRIRKNTSENPFSGQA